MDPIKLLTAIMEHFHVKDGDIAWPYPIWESLDAMDPKLANDLAPYLPSFERVKHVKNHE